MMRKMKKIKKNKEKIMGGTCFNLKEEGLHYSNLLRFDLRSNKDSLNQLEAYLPWLIAQTPNSGKIAALSIDVVLFVAGVGHAVREEQAKPWNEVEPY